MALPNRALEIKNAGRGIGNNTSAVDGLPVVASNDEQGPYCALWIANPGNVTVRMIGGATLTYANVLGGTMLSVMVDKVTACPAGTIGVW